MILFKPGLDFKIMFHVADENGRFIITKIIYEELAFVLVNI